MSDYHAQSARDARDTKYGGPSYWDYLEQHAHELHAYYTARGDHDKAAQMLTQTLSESLAGNDGD